MNVVDPNNCVFHYNAGRTYDTEAGLYDPERKLSGEQTIKTPTSDKMTDTIMMEGKATRRCDRIIPAPITR